ncbi:unnamed protein product, partial [Ostreobium quekettii]
PGLKQVRRSTLPTASSRNHKTCWVTGTRAGAWTRHLRGLLPGQSAPVSWLPGACPTGDRLLAALAKKGPNRQVPERGSERTRMALDAQRENISTQPGSRPARVRIDGGMLEGGGQLLRNSCALAAIKRVPIEVFNIRAGRAKPGLKPQHKTGIAIIADVCNGSVENVHDGSTTIRLDPGGIVTGSHVGDTKTAGSCTLLAQATLPVLLYAQPTDSTPISKLEFRGGTDAALAPPVGYLQHVLVPLLRARLGLEVEVELVRRGFYPRGGGIMKLNVKPLELGVPIPPVDLTNRGEITMITIHAFAAGRLLNKQQDIALAALTDLRNALGPAVRIQQHIVAETQTTAKDSGAGALVIAETDTGCILGGTAGVEKHQPAAAAGSQAAREVIDAIQSGCCVDTWMQDQMIIFMALAKGKSRMRCTEPTLHSRTAMVLAEMMIGCKFTVHKPRENGDQCWVVECQGADLTRS